ncbi:MAG: hypothetical protein ACI8PZ_005803 [Myxococcota bacterium]|jgi:hypothetical protein
MACADFDGDGARNKNDCAMHNSDVSPWESDLAGDDLDANCDGVDGIDMDQDGVASLISGGRDCDDRAPRVFPGADEVPGDGVDQDCDGFDLNVLVDPIPAPVDVLLVVDQTIWDHFGDAEVNALPRQWVLAAEARRLPWRVVAAVPDTAALQVNPETGGTVVAHDDVRVVGKLESLFRALDWQERPPPNSTLAILGALAAPGAALEETLGGEHTLAAVVLSPRDDDSDELVWRGAADFQKYPARVELHALVGRQSGCAEDGRRLRDAAETLGGGERDICRVATWEDFLVGVVASLSADIPLDPPPADPGTVKVKVAGEKWDAWRWDPDLQFLVFSELPPAEDTITVSYLTAIDPY